MNIEKFRADLQAFVASGVTQAELARRSGVSQCNISKILNNPSRDMNLSTAVKLWPFVYGCEFPTAQQNVLSAKNETL